MPTAQKPITCPYCDHAPFKSGQALKSHIHYKHKEEAVTAPTPAQENAPSAFPVSNDEIDALKAEIARLTEQTQIKKMPVVVPIVEMPKLTAPKKEIIEDNQGDFLGRKPPWAKIANAQPAKKVDVKLKELSPENSALVKALTSVPQATKNGIELYQSIMTSIEFKAGSWALIYKEDLVVRMIPFLWQQDKETKQNWAIMLEQSFYGKPLKPMQISYPLLIIPFDKSRKNVDYYGRGFLISVDEISQLQIPLHQLDNDMELNKRLEDNAFNSQNMALYRELIIHAKKKWNWTLIIVLILVAVVIGIFVYFLHTHPDFLQNIAKGI